MRSIGVQISLNLRCRALDALWFLPKESEDPVMDEATINRLLQNALDEANARAEQNLEERLTALRERKDDGLEGLTHVTVYTRSGNEFEIAVSAVCECPKAAALREALNRSAK